MKKNAKRRSDSALAKKNNKTTILRVEPLEAREMLSVTGWETEGNENVACFAPETYAFSEIVVSDNDVSSALTESSENTDWRITKITGFQVKPLVDSGNYSNEIYGDVHIQRQKDGTVVEDVVRDVYLGVCGVGYTTYVDAEAFTHNDKKLRLDPMEFESFCDAFDNTELTPSQKILTTFGNLRSGGYGHPVWGEDFVNSLGGKSSISLRREQDYSISGLFILDNDRSITDLSEATRNSIIKGAEAIVQELYEPGYDYPIVGDQVDTETLARKVAYDYYSEDQKGAPLWWIDDTLEDDDPKKYVFSQYVIDEIFDIGGFHAVGLVSNQAITVKGDDGSISKVDNSSVLAICGTEGSLFDLLSDTNPLGVGHDQFTLSYPEIKEWLQKQESNGKKVTITGHSLGGALSQWIAAEWTASGHSLDKVVTYNSPGISKKYADKCVSSRINEVTHHISVGDIVSMAGEAFIQGIRGDVWLYSFSSGYYDSYAHNKHSMAFSKDVALPSSLIAQDATKRRISTDQLNSFWFNYSNAEYNSEWSWIDQIALVRGTTEFGRKTSQVTLGEALFLAAQFGKMYGVGAGALAFIGGIVVSPTVLFGINSATLMSTNGWSLNDINTNYDAWIPGDITADGSGFSGGVDIRTPNGFSIPGLLHYSNFGLDSVTVDPTRCCNGFDLDGSGGGAFYVQNANMTLSNVSDIKTMSATYPQELPNRDYSLDGSMTLSFGSSSPNFSMGTISVSSLETVGNSEKLGVNVSSLNVTKQGKTLFSLAGPGKNFTFDGSSRLTGQGNFSFTLYDRNGNTWTSQTVTTSDSKIVFASGWLYNSITVTGNDLSLDYSNAPSKTPSLKYGGKLYSFNYETGRWEGKGAVSSTSSFSDSAALSATVSNGSTVTVSVSASSSQSSSAYFSSSPTIDFFLDTDRTGTDGTYIGSAVLSEMAQVNGSYDVSFDFSGLGLPSGNYWIYGHGDLENEEDSIYSAPFHVDYSSPLELSTTSLAFGETPLNLSVESAPTQDVTIKNVSPTPITFSLLQDEGRFFLKGQSSNGSPLESNTATLSPGESLTLAVLFVPNSEGTQTSKISLVGRNGVVYNEISLSGIGSISALPHLVAPTIASTSATENEITLKWNSVANAIGYVVEYKKTTDSSWTSTASTTSTSRTISNLTANTSYDVRVHAVGDGVNFSNSASSAVKTVKTEPASVNPTTLDAPTISTATPTSTSVALKWNAVANASGYIVEYKESTASTFKALESTTSTSQTVSNLKPDTAYDFRVYAKGDGTNYSDSASSAVKTVKTDPAPVTPTTLDAPTISTATPTSTSVALKWNAVANASGYVVEYKESTASKFTTVDATTSTSQTVSNLKPGTNYEFRVYAKGDGTNYSDSASSAVKAVKTYPTPVTPTTLDAPTISTATPTSTTVALKWNAIENASGYIVEYKESTASTFTSMEATTSTSQTISNLKSDTAYEFRVYAKGDETNYSDSDYSAVKTVKTDPTPVTPTKLEAPTISTTTPTSTTVALKWNAIANASGYIVEYKESTASNFTPMESTTSTSQTISNLKSDTNYEFRVYAKGDGTSFSNSVPSAVKTVRTDPTPTEPTTISTSTEGATVSDDEIAVNEDFKVVCEVVNDGEHIADVATVSFYATTDPNDLTSGVLLGTVQTEGRLEPGEKETVELETSFPETTPGEYYIGWTVEWSNKEESAQPAVAVLPDAITVDPPTETPQTPSIAIDAPTPKITTQNATAGAFVATVFARNFTPESYRVYADGTQSADFAVENGKLVLTKALAVGTYANITVVADYNGALVESEPFTLTVTTSEVPGSAPKAPSNLVFGEYDFATRKLPMSWTDNSNDETKFVTQYSYDGVNWNRGGETAANVSERVATGVASDRTYYFRVAAYNDYGYSDWTEASIHTPSAPTPNPSLLDAPAISYYDVAETFDVQWSAVPNTSGYMVEISSDADFTTPQSATTTDAFFSTALIPGWTDYYCRVKALGTGDYLDSGWSEVVHATVGGGEGSDAVWNLDDFSVYKSFKLDATPDSNVTATLYGLEKNGTFSVLQTQDNLGTGATATITGRNVVAENLWITESAAALLGGVVFNGGELLLDKLTLDGTTGDDNLTISTETVVTETQIFTTNPYEKALANYRKIYGESSPIYQKIAANLDAAYQKLSKHVATKKSTWGVVELNGTTTKFLGTRDVAINTGAGDDSIQVDALHYNYTISTEGANNLLDFSEAKGRLNLDLGANYRQCALIGDGGTLKVDGTFTDVTGTQFNDHVVGSDAGLTFVGNGGSDSVTLVGGENNVELVGPRQSVVARGNGVYNVTIEQGDYSVVNAGGVTKRGAVSVAIEGKNATVYGGLGTLEGAVEGDYATVNAGAIHESAFGVVGDHAVITTGGGVDIVTLVGDNGSIVVGAGDDIVYVYGTNENIRLGTGNDECVIGDGESGKAGVNYIWGDAGNDVIVAAETTGANYLYAGAGNDVIVGGAGGDYIYANSGDNILIGLGGSDRLYGGSGRDVLIASTSDLLTSDDLTYRETLDALFAAWNVEKDVDATIQLLGEHCVADGSKDWLYRGAGRNNLLYASQLDVDVENALERSPFNDVLVLDDPDAADDSE